MPKRAGSSPEVWPDLPLEAWSETCTILHMWTQIVGKIRLLEQAHLKQCVMEDLSALLRQRYKPCAIGVASWQSPHFPHNRYNRPKRDGRAWPDLHLHHTTDLIGIGRLKQAAGTTAREYSVSYAIYLLMACPHIPIACRHIPVPL